MPKWYFLFDVRIRRRFGRRILLYNNN